MKVKIRDQNGVPVKEVYCANDADADASIAALSLPGWSFEKEVPTADYIRARLLLKSFDKIKAKDPEIADAIDALIVYLGLM